MPRHRRVEYGSNFHWLSYQPKRTSHPWNGTATRFASGRAALCSLLAYGKQTFGWRTVWLPTFYCHDVTRAVRSAGFQVKLYSDDPLRVHWDTEAPRWKRQDAIVCVNYYGIRRPIGQSTFDDRGI